MASQTQGIQQLLAAEKRARKRKNRRLKQAKDEAQVEIEKYMAERDRAFKDNEAKNVGSKEDIAIKIDVMNRSVASNKAEVISNLISLVCDIKPEVHKNYRGGA